jgi:hypothetical protein
MKLVIMQFGGLEKLHNPFFLRYFVYVFIVLLTKLLIGHALTSSSWMLANNEFEIMLKEMIMALNKVLPFCLEGLRISTKNLNQDNRCHGRDSKRAPLVHNSETLPLEETCLSLLNLTLRSGSLNHGKITLCPHCVRDGLVAYPRSQPEQTSFRHSSHSSLFLVYYELGGLRNQAMLS